MIGMHSDHKVDFSKQPLEIGRWHIAGTDADNFIPPYRAWITKLPKQLEEILSQMDRYLAIQQSESSI
jgi:hypothetical protein